jgi:hypothetical protein
MAFYPGASCYKMRGVGHECPGRHTLPPNEGEGVVGGILPTDVMLQHIALLGGLIQYVKYTHRVPRLVSNTCRDSSLIFLQVAAIIDTLEACTYKVGSKLLTPPIL